MNHKMAWVAAVLLTMYATAGAAGTTFRGLGRGLDLSTKQMRGSDR